jgi:hypothetical protein
VQRILVAAVVLAALTATASSAAAPVASRGPLTGTWKGVLTNGTRKEPLTITIGGAEKAGTWKVSASCHGKLSLDSISGGSHHFLRHVAAGATCAGGDIDCLWTQGKSIYDNVTPRTGGWSRNGTLHRVKTA